jgi:hypothetical protein
MRPGCNTNVQARGLCSKHGGSSQTLCTVRVFRLNFTLEDAIGSHACSLEASMRLTNGMPLGCPFLLPVGTVNCVQALKATSKGARPRRSSVGCAANTEGMGCAAQKVAPPTLEVVWLNSVVNTTAIRSVRCAFFGRNLHSRMPLVPTPARLKQTRV